MRVSSILPRSHATISVSSRSVVARASTRPNGSATNELPQNVEAAFAADAIHGRDEHAVRDRVRALRGLPGVALRLVDRRILAIEPADRGGIDEHVRAGERRQSRAFREPLIPAHEDTELAARRLVHAEAEIAGREVELLVEERVVGNVHLAVLADDAAVRIEYGGSIVIEALGALLEERGDDHDLGVARHLGERLGRRPGDRFGELEELVILALAEVARTEELLQADDLGAPLCGFANALDRLLDVLRRLLFAAHLHEAERDRWTRLRHGLVLAGAECFDESEEECPSADARLLRMKRLASVLAIATLLSGCGGGSSSPGAQAALSGVSFEVFASGLAAAEGLAFDGAGNLLVTLERRDGAGEVVRIEHGGGTSSVAGGLDRPDGIAFDRAGNLFVTEEVANGRVVRITGGASATFVGGLAGPEGLAFEPSGNLLVTEDIGGRVLRVSPDGAVTPIATLRKPEGVAVAGDGRIWVAESDANRIVALGTGGAITSAIDAGLQAPDGLAWDEPTQSLLVSEDRPSGARLLRIASDGAGVVVLDGLEYAQGIAIGSDRAIYLAENVRGRVLRVVGALAP